jgi:cytochrome c-type biogenesis protein CcmE
MRMVRISAVILATAGLILLYLAAKHHEPPLVPIDSITPVMNFAHVRVAGTVSKRPYKSRDGNTVSFTITDGSGALRVSAYRNVAKALLQDNASLPAAGDRVELKGSLSISAERTPKLYLKSADHLTRITPKLAP